MASTESYGLREPPNEQKTRHPHLSAISHGVCALSLLPVISTVLESAAFGAGHRYRLLSNPRKNPTDCAPPGPCRAVIDDAGHPDHHPAYVAAIDRDYQRS